MRRPWSAFQMDSSPKNSFARTILSEIKRCSIFPCREKKGLFFTNRFRGSIKRSRSTVSRRRSAAVDYQANALGIAGAETWGKGSFGLSLAYLWSSLADVVRIPGQPDQSHLDTADGVRLNLGIRQPTGPLMWGVVLQNMPAFLWGDTYRRQMLPPIIRVGNTLRAYPGILLSIDWERRFYHEGGDPINQLYVGGEIFAGDKIVLRVGAFGQNLDESDQRHFTAGIGFRPHPGLELSYAYETYDLLEERVRRSFVSFKYPFDTSVDEPAHK